jgi:hypothetical protein
LFGLIKRHEVQVLRRAGHSQVEVARLTGVSLSEIRRIEAEAPIDHFDDAAERRRRGIGRPSKAEPLRSYVTEQLAASPRATSLDLLRGAKAAGYTGSKSAFYALVARLRPDVTRSVGTVGEVPGDESQHGFGEVDVRLASGGLRRIQFFVSQLSYSRWSEASIVPSRHVEALLRSLVEHFVRMGGAPLVAVFDRHNASAVVANVDGGGGPWDPAFAQAILDLGVGVDLRGRGRNERSGGSVDRLVRWVKDSFFRGRRFADARDVGSRLAEWIRSTNTRTAARPTGAVPESRMGEERVRLRPLAFRPEDFALRIPVVVEPGGQVAYEGASYPVPSETSGKRATLHLHTTRVRIVGDGFDIRHPREPPFLASEFPE